jgi:hypothetical protein
VFVGSVVVDDEMDVELARHILGPDWLPQYVAAANRGGIERVLV